MITEPRLPRVSWQFKDMIMKLRSKHGGGRIRSGLTLLVLALPVLLLSPSATAERMHGSPQGRGHHISGVHKHNNAALRGGHSSHGRHHGHLQCHHLRGHHLHGHHHRHFSPWWVNSGLWYSYPAPVYSYPYSTVYTYRYPYVPPVAVASPPIYIGPAMQYWSFCEASGAYYPNVTTCPGGWKQVQIPLNGTSPVPQQ
jgi:hypothetical protein